MGEIVLDVRNQKTSFVTGRGMLAAVNGVSSTLERGKTLGVVGESGSGKSVLSRSIMRLLPGNALVPADSRVVLNGKDLTRLDEGALRRLRGPEMAIVFQDPMTSLNPVLTIGKQIMEVLTFHLGMPKRAARARAVELLKAVGLPQPDVRVDQYPHQLSGGMRQRLQIARNLVTGPRLVFMDEPTGGLDVSVQARLLDLLRGLVREMGLSAIIVTHDLAVVRLLADRLMVMKGGHVLEQGLTDQVLDDPQHGYTQLLVSSVLQV